MATDANGQGVSLAVDANGQGVGLAAEASDAPELDPDGDGSLAAVIIDISVAFMHAPMDERVVVKAPKDIPSKTGYWVLKKALNGTQRASQLWTEWSAEQFAILDFIRNEHNPSIFYNKEHDSDNQQHGDDFFIIGARNYLIDLIKHIKELFQVKKAILISMHPEDEKHGSFLHRDIRVHEDGWNIELNREYADRLSSTMGVVGQKRPSTIP